MIYWLIPESIVRFFQLVWFVGPAGWNAYQFNSAYTKAKTAYLKGQSSGSQQNGDDNGAAEYKADVQQQMKDLLSIYFLSMWSI